MIQILIDRIAAKNGQRPIIIQPPAGGDDRWFVRSTASSMYAFGKTLEGALQMYDVGL